MQANSSLQRMGACELCTACLTAIDRRANTGEENVPLFRSVQIIKESAHVASGRRYRHWHLHRSHSLVRRLLSAVRRRHLGGAAPAARLQPYFADRLCSTRSACDCKLVLLLIAELTNDQPRHAEALYHGAALQVRCSFTKATRRADAINPGVIALSTVQHQSLSLHTHNSYTIFIVHALYAQPEAENIVVMLRW